MDPNSGSVMGPPARRSRRTPRTGLAFPKDLVHPPQSQLSLSEDAVGNRVVQLDMWAQRLGEGFGISFTTFTLNALSPNLENNIAAAMLAAFVLREERVSLGACRE